MRKKRVGCRGKSSLPAFHWCIALGKPISAEDLGRIERDIDLHHAKWDTHEGDEHILSPEPVSGGVALTTARLGKLEAHLQNRQPNSGDQSRHPIHLREQAPRDFVSHLSGTSRYFVACSRKIGRHLRLRVCQRGFCAKRQSARTWVMPFHLAANITSLDWSG